MVESTITKIDSSIKLTSERLNSQADTGNELAKQDSLLNKEQAPQIVRSFCTRISYLQRREVTSL